MIVDFVDVLDIVDVLVVMTRPFNNILPVSKGGEVVPIVPNNENNRSHRIVTSILLLHTFIF